MVGHERNENKNSNREKGDAKHLGACVPQSIAIPACPTSVSCCHWLYDIPFGAMSARVLAYDLGGTKIAAAIVSREGKILSKLKTPVASDRQKSSVLRQMTALGRQLLDGMGKKSVLGIGIASAGPLDPGDGVLLDPTNLSGKEHPWGRVPIAKILSKNLGLPSVLENDAAAAILAEQWLGRAKKSDNAMILTLGTGLGTGILCNGQLVRAGRGLHTEGGHLILNWTDTTARCGCGNDGCAEAYLSGTGFAHRFQKLHADIVPAITRHSPTGAFDSAAVAHAARQGPPGPARAAFEEYGRILALAIHNYTVVFAPEIVILTGSFAEASDLFLNTARQHLQLLLVRRRKGVDLLPKIVISNLHNDAGVLGGARVAFDRFLRR